MELIQVEAPTIAQVVTETFVWKCQLSCLGAHADDPNKLHPLTNYRSVHGVAYIQSRRGYMYIKYCSVPIARGHGAPISYH